MCKGFGLLAASGLLLLGACAAADQAATGGPRGGAGRGGSDAFGNVARAGRGGSGGAGEIPGGQTTGIPNEAPPPLAGSGGGTMGDDCTATGAEAEVGRQGADMVWIVDNSCSMAFEAVSVQTNLNRFAQQLVDNGVDVHMVLISSSNTSYQMNAACPPDDLVCAITSLVGSFTDFGICIGAPFGSGMCPADSKAPNYLHIDMPVGSNNGLQMALDLYPQYASMMRPNASKHFAIVTDDDSDLSADAFTQGVNALDPTLFASWRYHGIFSFTDCPDAAKVGSVHRALVDQTGGVAGDLCSQMFDPVFDELAQDVVMKAEIACDWPIPEPPAGQSLDSEKINVNFTQPDGTVVSLGRIPPGESCDGREGWYYDDDAAPTTVISCPASCDKFKATGGKVDVLFGCRVVLVQ